MFCEVLEGVSECDGDGFVRGADWRSISTSIEAYYAPTPVSLRTSAGSCGWRQGGLGV